MPDPRDPEFPESAADASERVLALSRGRAFCLFTSYSQMRVLYDRLLPVLDFPILLHGTAPRKALLGRVSRYTERRPLWHRQLLAGCRRAGRSPQLRHHRPPSLRRSQRSRRPGAHESHRRKRRPSLLRLPGPRSRPHPQAGLRPPHPLARRSRRPRPPRPPDPQASATARYFCNPSRPTA